MGKEADFQVFSKRAQNYRNVTFVVDCVSGFLFVVSLCVFFVRPTQDLHTDVGSKNAVVVFSQLQQITHLVCSLVCVFVFTLVVCCSPDDLEAATPYPFGRVSVLVCCFLFPAVICVVK